MELAITALVAAGAITGEDDKVMLIQRLSKGQAIGVAQWLAIATGGAVELRHISPLEGGALEIRLDPQDVKWMHLPGHDEGG